MADISITAANVHIQSDDVIIPVLRSIKFGDAMAAGKACIYDFESDEEKAFLADATTSSGLFNAKGIVLTGAADDAWGVVLEYGLMDVGATLTAGRSYGLSETAGGIALVDDFSGYTSATQCHLFYATASDTAFVKPFLTGATT